MPVSDAILSGDTADVYFARTQTILAHAGLDPVVVMEIFPGRAGVLCGIREALDLLRAAAATAEVDALDEVLIIAAGLSIQDPRERPLELRDTAVPAILAGKVSLRQFANRLLPGQLEALEESIR